MKKILIAMLAGLFAVATFAQSQSQTAKPATDGKPAAKPEQVVKKAPADQSKMKVGGTRRVNPGG